MAARLLRVAGNDRLSGVEEYPDVLLQAIADVVKARGVARIAQEAGLGRESLYKSLAPGAGPRYDTILRLIRALGVRLHAATVPAGTRR